MMNYNLLSWTQIYFYVLSQFLIDLAAKAIPMLILPTNHIFHIFVGFDANENFSYLLDYLGDV